MKKVLIVIGSFLLVGGLGATYVYKIQVPEITVNSVDWNKKQISFTVRGKKYYFTAMANGLSTLAPIKFSKYTVFFTPNQSNSNDIWRLVIEDGDVSVGKQILFDFKNKKQL